MQDVSCVAVCVVGFGVAGLTCSTLSTILRNLVILQTVEVLDILHVPFWRHPSNPSVASILFMRVHRTVCFLDV